MTVQEKIEELRTNGISEIKLYAEESNMELPMTGGNLDVEYVDCIISGNTADLYI